LLGFIFEAAAIVSPLKLAFQQSRAQRNIDLVLPVLRTTTLYVAVGSEPLQGQRPEWFLTESPTKGRFCVTASETETALSKVPWPKLRLSGVKLLEALPPAIELIIVYADGGDYITREKLDWYRQVK
jgi:fimbrial chaperone protein